MTRKLLIIIIVTFTFALLSLCIASFIIFSKSLHPNFDFTSPDKVSIATVFGSILGPMSSIASIVLLYLTLSEQIENSKKLEFKNEFELAALQYNQLENEYYRINDQVKHTRGSDKSESIQIKYGYDAFMDICLRGSKNFRGFVIGYGADKVRAVISTFELTESVIEKVQNDETKTLYKKKLESFYNLKFRDALRQFCYGIKDIENKEIASDVFNFFLERERKFHDSGFDIFSFKNVSELFK